MSKYINAEEFKESIKDQLIATTLAPRQTYGQSNIMDQIDAMEGVDVDQIIDEHIGEYLAARCQVLVSAEAMNQRRAHWIKLRGGKYVCSNCNMDALFDNTTCMVPSRFCPSCGRWMCGPIEDLTEESEER